ncbi:MAG: ASKHA domain-containing protein [Oscillospiraceae bacterium]
MKEKILSCEKLREERSGNLALAIDISNNLMVAVWYDLQLKRRFARASLFGIEISPDNVCECVIKLVTSSMRNLDVISSEISSVGIAASLRIEGVLEEELSPYDLYLNPDIEFYYVPYISASISGRFTASLLTLPEDDCLAADFGKELCIAEKRRNTYRCASFPLSGAFDGSGYESGIPSENGAIDFVRAENDGTIVYEVIGDGDSAGISSCGAAASVSVMLDIGALDSDGIMTDRDLFAIGEDYFVSQNDVRVFQTDKASAASALRQFSGTSKAFLSGEIFASPHGLRLMTKLGVIPKSFSPAFCRNSAEQGIIMCLENPEARERAAFIAKNALDVTADLLQGYDENYFDNISFEKKCEN